MKCFITSGPGDLQQSEAVITPDRRQSKTLILSNVDPISLETVSDCYLLSEWRRMAIENTVSSVL